MGFDYIFKIDFTITCKIFANLKLLKKPKTHHTNQNSCLKYTKWNTCRIMLQSINRRQGHKVHENIICTMLPHYPCPLQKLLLSKVLQVKQSTVSYNSQFSTEVEVVCTTLHHFQNTMWVIWHGQIVTKQTCPFPSSPQAAIPSRIHSTVSVMPSSSCCYTWSEIPCKWVLRHCFKAAGPVQSLLLKLYNHISLCLAACTHLTSDGEQAQQANPAESFSLCQQS